MSFADVVGHRAQIDFLRRVVAGGRLAHALLLAGPPGIGKRLVADALTAMLLCEEKGEDACGRCASCRQFAAGSHPDLLIVTLPKDKREIPIEKAREMNQFLRLQPLRGGHKVAIVDDAQLMNLAAQNALLKGLEEPPKDSVVILVANNPDALLPTIRSRCQRLLFAPLSESELLDALERRAGLPRADAQALVDSADGSPGRALRLRNAISRVAAPRLADLSTARYGALVQTAAALAESEEKAFVGLEVLLHSCRDEAVRCAREGDIDGASAATDAGGAVVDALANLRRRSANRALLLESTLLQVSKRYARGRRA